jgi:ribosomal protein S27E
LTLIQLIINNFIICFRREIKIEPEDEQDFNESSIQVAPVFIDPDFENSSVKFEPKVEINEGPNRTFDGNWSEDDDNHDDSNDDFEFQAPKAKQKHRQKKLDPQNLESRINLGKHKFRSLVGKLACRYCDTLFPSKLERDMHVCKYLQCKNPNNFICRFCNKELSKKTFSNHVHEATECQYCGRKILNPRNMKLHIQKKHKNAKYIPPKERNVQDYIKEKVEEEKRILEIRGELPSSKHPKVKKRYECDLCGRYLASLFSLRYHMNLHLGISRFICPICGEKFYTPTGYL